MSTKYNNEKLVAVDQLKKAIQDYDASFEKVAVTGSYNDLKDTPTLHKVATSGKYSDLTGRPTKVSQFTNDAKYQTETQVDDKIAAQVAKVYRPKGSVANYESLPTSTAQEGDVYNLLDTDMNYAFTADGTWDPLATTVDLSGLVKEEDLADVATSGSYNDLKDKPAETGGSLWGESASKGVYYPKTADIGNLGQDTVYVGDKAKDTAPKATRSLISISGVGTTLGISNPAGTTAYKMSDTYANRIMASVLAAGGFVALNETSARTKTASVTSVKMQDGSNLTPGHADSYGGTSNPIVITVSETVNPDAATSSLRFYGRFNNNNYLIAGMGVSATGSGKCIISGQHIGNTGSTSVIAGNTIYNKGARSSVVGQNIVNTQDSATVHGLGHDTTNGSEAMTVFGKYSDLSDPNTYFAIGDGSSDTSRSNLFDIDKTGKGKIKNVGISMEGHTHKANEITDGPFAANMIPNLPASKITSGLLSLNRGGTAVDGTSVSNNLVFASPNGRTGFATFRYLVPNDIPDLPASKITGGTFDPMMIPSLDASKITTGLLSASRIPDLDASKITSGTLPIVRGGTGVTANPSMLTNLGSTNADTVFKAYPRPGVTGTLPIANGGTGATTAASAWTALGGGPIGKKYSLDASDITSGTLDAARIPKLDASKITSGILDPEIIGDIYSNNIVGVLKRENIPMLDANKINFGTSVKKTSVIGFPSNSELTKTNTTTLTTSSYRQIISLLGVEFYRIGTDNTEIVLPKISLNHWKIYKDGESTKIDITATAPYIENGTCAKIYYLYIDNYN